MNGLRGWFRKKLSLRARPGEQGFTLAEVLISVAILGIIAGALAAAFVTTGRSSVGVSERFSESHDAQIASAYLATDVQSNAALTATVCGSGGSSVINFGYSDGSVATYAYGASGSESRLTRRFCSSGGGATSDVVLVHNGGGTPTVTCDGAACSVGSTPQPNKVGITIPEHNSATGANDYTYSLSGSRRACVNTVIGTPTTTAPCSGSTSNPPPPAPYGLIAFNNGKVTLGGNSNSTLTVYGPMVVDSTAPDAVSVGGPANNPRITVLDKQGNPGIFAIRQGGGCQGCATKVSPYPPSSFSDPIQDPFRNLPYPDEAGLPVYTDGAYHGPGVYRSQPLSFAGNSNTFTLAAGIYILEAGIRVSGNGNKLTGTDVLLFNGCGRNSGACSAGTGSGTFDLSGQNTVFQLDPYQTGTYEFLLLWQPPLNTQPVTIAGGGNEASLLKGILYAPGSTGLSIGSGSATLRIWCVAGTNITLGGQGSVFVGQ
jgi:prepilin-type N-terminal cleavage/methylation domain-containing protein